MVGGGAGVLRLGFDCTERSDKTAEWGQEGFTQPSDGPLHLRESRGSVARREGCDRSWKDGANECDGTGAPRVIYLRVGRGEAVFGPRLTMT